MEFFQSIYIGKIIYDDFFDDLRFNVSVIIEKLLMDDFPSELKQVCESGLDFLLSEFLD